MLGFGCCCWRILCICTIRTSLVSHKVVPDYHLRSPRSGKKIIKLNFPRIKISQWLSGRIWRGNWETCIPPSLVVTCQKCYIYKYLQVSIEFTLSSPGMGSMPVTLRPWAFLPRDDLTWMVVWYFRWSVL